MPQPQLTIILTSYNRPLFIRRAITSVIAQTDPRWRLVIRDDGSDQETREAINAYWHQNMHVALFDRRGMTLQERQSKSRYAVLINEVLPTVKTPLVCYMCDNVEYDREFVAQVIDWFETHPERFSGYVWHKRDMWTADGRQRLGDASIAGHWDYTPPVEGVVIQNAMGVVDHSQVIHRLPIAARWEEDISAVGNGDGVFFNRLIAETGRIYPIAPGKVLSMEHLIK